MMLIRVMSWACGDCRQLAVIVVCLRGIPWSCGDYFSWVTNSRHCLWQVPLDILPPPNSSIVDTFFTYYCPCRSVYIMISREYLFFNYRENIFLEVLGLHSYAWQCICLLVCMPFLFSVCLFYFSHPVQPRDFVPRVIIWKGFSDFQEIVYLLNY